MAQHIAIYLRVSSKRQEHRSQEPDLRRYVAAYAGDREVVWYTDKVSGSAGSPWTAGQRKRGPMVGPAWERLEAAYRTGAVERIVVWRLDRLGRTSSGLTALFDELRRMGVALVSVREGFDLTTPAGAMVATILASVAQHELEVRGERQAAGIAAAKAQGKTWGGRKPGARWKVTPELERMVIALDKQDESIAAISRATNLSRPTIYALLDR